MRLFGRKREEKQFLNSVQSRDMRGSGERLKLLQVREVIPGRKWEYLDGDEVVAEQTVYDQEAYRHFLDAMSKEEQ